MNQTALTRERLKTPRAAAVAGIIFAVLFTVSLVLIRVAVPEDLTSGASSVWVKQNSATVSVALTLVPFAGIAFLWFIGVVRDRLGKLEDQFFSTVFFGSGLLFIARMAGVFMIALGTIWVRTRVMPRLFVFVTYGLALVMLVSINLSPWLILVFPDWVFVVSVYVLIESLRGEQLKAEEILGSTDSIDPKGLRDL